MTMFGANLSAPNFLRDFKGYAKAKLFFVHVARLLPESNMEQGRRGDNECDVSLYFLLQLCHRNELI